MSITTPPVATTSYQPYNPFEEGPEASEITSEYKLKLGARFAVGTYADVYKATLIPPGSSHPYPVAVKVLRFYGMNMDLPELYKQNLIRIDKRLGREMYVWKRLKNPRTTPLLGYARSSSNVISDDRPVLVSPYRENSNLRTYMVKNPDANRLLLLQQVSEGLDYLHNFEPPIAHLDLKPENILINDQGEAELCDFGLAKALEDVRTGFTTSSGSGPGGTTIYMAPEVLNEGDRTTASDIYGMGCVILDVMSGVPPWGKTAPGKIVLQVAKGQTPPKTLHVIAGYPQPVIDAIWALMKRCWALDPLDRPKASEVRDELINIRAMVP